MTIMVLPVKKSREQLLLAAKRRLRNLTRGAPGLSNCPLPIITARAGSSLESSRAGTHLSREVTLVKSEPSCEPKHSCLPNEKMAVDVETEKLMEDAILLMKKHEFVESEILFQRCLQRTSGHELIKTKLRELREQVLGELKYDLRTQQTVARSTETIAEAVNCVLSRQAAPTVRHVSLVTETSDDFDGRVFHPRSSFKRNPAMVTYSDLDFSFLMSNLR
ncbi:hypothetical protein HDE_10923 [Halotydeus destructor]|nr:hypothetical protein HDE_10923 [Halotydeus destructor]